jgi:hypothetical protein
VSAYSHGTPMTTGHESKSFFKRLTLLTPAPGIYRICGTVPPTHKLLKKDHVMSLQIDPLAASSLDLVPRQSIAPLFHTYCLSLVGVMAPRHIPVVVLGDHLRPNHCGNQRVKMKE